MNFFANWMKNPQTTTKKQITKYDIKWYDKKEDWLLIVVSFAKEYGLLLDEMDDNDLFYHTFLRLLQGLSPETPLGYIVTIRSEEDIKIRKKFTDDEKKIWLEWQKRVPIEYKQQKLNQFNL